MTPQQLKNSILQLAVQGKLVEQRPEEGTGEELYKQIQAEKQRLIKEGKIKKEKPLEEIREDEIPFDIPATWKWCRLDDTVRKTIKRGKSPTYSQNGKVLVFAQKCNVKTGGIDLSLALRLDDRVFCNYPPEECMENEDIVINSTGGGTMGRVGFYHNTDNPSTATVVPDGHVTIIRASTFICPSYMFYFLKHAQEYLEKQGEGSTNQTELRPFVLKNLVFPLPPSEEQQRIVAKIEELMPLVEQYEEAYNKLENLNKKFPEDMQKAILQYAVQGKLVEQRPEEGTGGELYKQIQIEKQRLIKEGKIKKEKPLEEIREDEIPFDIPDSWKWVRISNVFNVEMGQSPQGDLVSEFIDGMEFHQGKICFGDKYLGLSAQKTKVPTKIAPSKSVLLCVRAPVGKVNITNRQICIGRGLCSITPLESMSVDFVYYLFATYEKIFAQQATGTTFVAVTSDIVKKQIVPLPPLGEQQRIVAKIEELMPLIELLKEK